MSILSLLQNMKSVYYNLLLYIEHEENEEENYGNLLKSFEEHKIEEKKHELLLLLYIISSISNNHFRTNNFFEKIEKILIYYKNAMRTYYSNSEMFDIFNKNKRILLFLIKQNIISITNSIVNNFLQNQKYRERKYLEYFFPEIKSFIDDKELIAQITKEIPSDFEEKRMEGENESTICQLIRQDMIEKFLLYINKKDLSINSKIQESIFETHPLLLKNGASLIEYAAFFGSIQIFTFLHRNKAKKKDNLRYYSIYGDNQEIIDILYQKTDILKCIKTSIKCHHNHITDYLKNNSQNPQIFEKIYDHNLDDNFIAYCYKYYNFANMADDFGDKHIFLYLCRYNYYTFVEMYLQTKNVNINKSHSNGITALRLAGIGNNIDIINLLFKQPWILIGQSFTNCKRLKRLVIPSFITTIEANAFRDCISLKKIYIPLSIKTIGENAFKRCSSLKKVIIPLQIKEIKNSTFESCSSLTEISIPPTVTSIGKSAFKGCSSLMEIVIPSAIMTIEESTFELCSSLKEISIPSTVVSIGAYAFKGCSLLTQIAIPSAIKVIEKSTFESCSSLEKISIPLTLASIGESAFKGCSSLKEINIPQNIKEIKKSTFESCSSLTDISIPPTVTSIGKSAFKGCSSLMEVAIPSSIMTIEESTFESCTSLKGILIPSSITYIECKAFANCKSLEQISIPPTVESIEKNAFEGCSFKDPDNNINLWLKKNECDLFNILHNYELCKSAYDIVIEKLVKTENINRAKNLLNLAINLNYLCEIWKWFEKVDPNKLEYKNIFSEDVSGDENITNGDYLIFLRDMGWGKNIKVKTNSQEKKFQLLKKKCNKYI